MFLSNRVLYLYAFGFPNAWQRSIVPTKHCDLRNQQRRNPFKHAKGQQHSIKLKELTGPFLILGIGLSLGLLVFLLEKIVSVWKENMQISHVIPPSKIIIVVPKANEIILTKPLSPLKEPHVIIYDVMTSFVEAEG